MTAFVLMLGRVLPFPIVVLGAALVGALAGRRGAAAGTTVSAPARFPWRTLAAGVALWCVPALAILVLAGGESLYFDVYRFFTTATLVTFGGAYAVLAWVNQQVVEVYGWLTQADTIAGLALAETTPGPLIIVLQFIGFMAGWNNPGADNPGFVATVMALLTSWAVFLPAVVLMLVGAPYVEKVTSNARFGAALAGITAAVVGVIASLAIAFGRSVLFPGASASRTFPRWASRRSHLPCSASPASTSCG